MLQVAETAGEHNGRKSEQDADICGDQEEGGRTAAQDATWWVSFDVANVAITALCTKRVEMIWYSCAHKMWIAACTHL